MAHDVFISYSSIDKVVADAVVASLEKENIRCWYAPRDIPPGSDWGDEIAKAVNNSSVFLLIFSSNSDQSQRVLDELNLAISNEATIIPFRIENLNPSGAMELHLSARHWLDAFDPTWKKHISNMVNVVMANLNSIELKKRESDESTDKTRFVPRKKINKSYFIVGTLLLISVGIIFGVQKLMGQTKENEPIIQETATETIITPAIDLLPMSSVTPEPSGPALGSIDNPLIWMYVPSEFITFEEVNNAANDFSQIYFDSNDGFNIKFLPATSTESIVLALCEGGAHIGSLDAFSYLKASKENCADAKLIWSAHEDIKWGGMIFINANRDSITSLEELEGKILCIPSYTSISGWILPSLEIRALFGDPFEFFGEIIDMGSHDQVLESVYFGTCNLGTSYYDVRESSNLPDVMDVVEIVSKTISVPQTNISFQSDLDLIISQQLITSLLSMSVDNEQLAIIHGFMDGERITSENLIEINDYYYDELRSLFERAGEDVEDYQ